MRIYSVLPAIYDQSLPQFLTATASIEKLLTKTSLTGTETILDACCGTGKITQWLGENYVPHGRVLGLDYADNMIEFAKQNHLLKQGEFKVEDLTVFNEAYSKIADVLVCSWAVSHIPQEQQSLFTKNLFNYLKDNGQLIVLFPIMGSMLSDVINEVVRAPEWASYFKELSAKRSSFKAEEYGQLLQEHGFAAVATHIEPHKIYFKDADELRPFIVSSVARYLGYIPTYDTYVKFIQALMDKYLSKAPKTHTGIISYETNILIAHAKRPVLSLLQTQTMFKNNQDAVFDLNEKSCSITGPSL